MIDKNNLKSSETDRESGSKIWKDFFKLGEVGNYFFRSKDPARPTNVNLKMMHGVNKISMLMFLACVLIIIIRIIVRKYS